MYFLKLTETSVLTVANRVHGGAHGERKGREKPNYSERGRPFRSVSKCLLRFGGGAECDSVQQSAAGLCLQSRFSGTQKPITGAEPISYPQL